MEELESNYLEEMRGLVEEYQKNGETPEVFKWNDKRMPVEETPKKEYEHSLEGELLQEIDETTDPKIRKDLIEQLTSLRQINKDSLKNKIQVGTQKFIKEYNAKANEELEDYKKQLEEAEENRKKVVSERIRYKNLKLSFQDNEAIYKAANEEEMKSVEKIKVFAKAKEALSDKIDALKSGMENINNYYGTMDFNDDSFIYNLDSAIGRKDVKDTVRVENEELVTPDRVIDNFGEVIDFAKEPEEINDVIEPGKEEQKVGEEKDEQVEKPEENAKQEQEDYEEQKFEEPTDIKKETPKLTKQKPVNKIIVNNANKTDTTVKTVKKEKDTKNVENKIKPEINMPIKKIEINASKNQAIVTFNDPNREQMTYSIKEIMKNKKSIMWINRPQDKNLLEVDRKDMMKKANPVIVKVLADYSNETNYDMLGAYYNNITKSKEIQKQPTMLYLLRNSTMSFANNRAMKKYAINEENIAHVLVDRTPTLKERFEALFSKDSQIKELASSTKRKVKNKAKTIQDKLHGIKIFDQLGKTKNKVVDRIASRKERTASDFIKGLRKNVPTQKEQASNSRKFQQSEREDDLEIIDLNNIEEFKDETMEDIGKDVEEILKSESVKKTDEKEEEL
jgi:hypothetical protein